MVDNFKKPLHISTGHNTKVSLRLASVNFIASNLESDEWRTTQHYQRKALDLLRMPTQGLQLQRGRSGALLFEIREFVGFEDPTE